VVVAKMIKSSSVALIPDIFNALLAAMSAKSQVDSLVTMYILGVFFKGLE
jgi:hypothetical protein